MGYKKPADKKEGQDLVYEGEVKLPGVLETATDLLVMHEEICLLQDMVQRLINEKRDAGIQLELLVTLRHNSKSYEEAWANVMRLQTSDGSEVQTYANLLEHEQLHAPNAPHPLPSTSRPQMHSQPGNMVTPTQQSTHSQFYDNLPLSTSSPQQQYIPHGVAGNQIVPMTQGTAPQQYAPPNSQMVGQYQSNFAPPHTTSQGYHHPPPNVNQSYATTHVSQPRQQIAVSQYQSDPGPAVSQYPPGLRPAISQYEPGPGPAVSQYQPGPVSQYQSCPRPAVSGPRPAVSGPGPAVSQYQPGPVSQYQSGPRPAGQGWDGTQFSNPTQYQNYPQTENESVTHQTRADRLGHNENVDPAELNVQRQCMDMPASTSQDDQQSLNETNDSINPDTLPPPIMNFSMTPHNEVLESGLISGIVDARSGGDGLSLLPRSESGPLGLQITESGDHSPNVTYNHSISKSSSSIESDDLYNSGPVKPAYKYQHSSPPEPPLPEEAEGWVLVGEGGQDDVPSAPSTQKSHQPALMTQGSQDTEPRVLESEVKPIPKPRNMLRDKTQSVDVVEDQKRGEKVHPVMKRSCVSGSDLFHSQHTADQSNSTNLDKPTPRPRSRSPSPAASSNENSPSASPTPPYCNIQILSGRPPGQRPTHEMWSPTGPPKQLKSSTLPRQTQSVDRESEDKREITHFSSGSNIHGGEGLHLPLKMSTAQNTIEPETPVKGVIPPALMRVQNASSTSKLTSHGRGKESMPPIPQNPPTQPLSAQPTDSHPLLDEHPQTDTSTPDVPSSQSSAPYNPSEKPQGPHPVGDSSHPRSSVFPVPSNQSSASYSPSEKPRGPHPVTHPISPPVKETSHSRSSVPPVPSSQSSAPSEEPPSPHPVRDPMSSPVKETSRSRSSLFPAPPTKSQPVVGANTTEADSVITAKPDESRLDRGGEGAHALRKTIDQDRNPEESTMRDRANAHSGQRPENVSKKELVTEDAVKDVITDNKGLDDTTEMEQKYGISLTGTWICSYCTNMVQESLLRCDVCDTHRYESLV